MPPRSCCSTWHRRERRHAALGAHYRTGQVKHEVMAATDHPNIGDRMVRGAKRAGRPQRRAVAGAADGTVEARRLADFGHGHGREKGGRPTRSPFRQRPPARSRALSIVPQLRGGALAQTRCGYWSSVKVRVNVVPPLRCSSMTPSNCWVRMLTNFSPSDSTRRKSTFSGKPSPLS
jgi:hypothetical protein